MPVNGEIYDNGRSSTARNLNSMKISDKEKDDVNFVKRRGAHNQDSREGFEGVFSTTIKNARVIHSLRIYVCVLVSVLNNICPENRKMIIKIKFVSLVIVLDFDVNHRLCLF